MGSARGGCQRLQQGIVGGTRIGLGGEGADLEQAGGRFDAAAAGIGEGERPVLSGLGGRKDGGMARVAAIAGFRMHFQVDLAAAGGLDFAGDLAASVGFAGRQREAGLESDRMFEPDHVVVDGQIEGKGFDAGAFREHPFDNAGPEPAVGP